MNGEHDSARDQPEQTRQFEHGYAPPPTFPPPASGAQPTTAYQQAYAAPPPPSGDGSRSATNVVAIVILGLVALSGLAVGALAAAGTFSHRSSVQTVTQVTSTRPGAAKSGAASSAPSATPAAGSAAAPTAGVTSCGGGVSAGANTSCGFAQNVEQAYAQTNGGTQVVSAYSSATGQTYTIDCTAGPAHVCTGGTTNNASVYFGAVSTSGGAPAGSSSSSANSGSLSACDSNISVNSVTSCPFAENVFQAYAQNYQSSGYQSDDVVSANSPTTGQTYSMNCTSDGSTVSCSGGNNAFVTFPMQAVRDY